MRNWCILSCAIRAADSKLMFCMCRKTMPWIHDPEQRIWGSRLELTRCVIHMSSFMRNSILLSQNHKWCLPLYIKQTSLNHKKWMKCVKCCHIRGMVEGIYGIKQRKCPNSLFSFHIGVRYSLSLVLSGQSVLDIWSLNSWCVWCSPRLGGLWFNTFKNHFV